MAEAKSKYSRPHLLGVPALPPPLTRQQLVTAYSDKGASQDTVARAASLLFGVSYYSQHVRAWLEHYGIPRRGRCEAQQVRQGHRQVVSAYDENAVASVEFGVGEGETRE